ncbi:MAG: glycosyltransferase [Planctomycetota bacterium]|nr:glycosyltransferase [Planctomycetota bacterium]
MNGMSVTIDQPPPHAREGSPERERAGGARGAVLGPLVGGCLKHAVLALQDGRGADAVEAIAAAAVADIQQYSQAFLRGVPEAAALGSLYERAFAQAGLSPGVREAAPIPRGRPARLVYVVGSVVEGQAASATIARLVALHDRRAFDPVVVVAEEATRRDPALTFLRQPDAPSERVGAPTLARLRAHAPVRVLHAGGTFVDGARDGVALMRDLAREAPIDLAVFVASSACPVQAGMAWARVAPTQCVLSVGSPLVLRGVDAVIFNNPRRRRADAPGLAAMGIRDAGVETSGGDAGGAAQALACTRASLGLPARAVVLASVSNALERRMLATTFARDLGAFLARTPDAWWVGVGACETDGLTRAIAAGAGDRANDVAARCVFLGARRDVPQVLKACDLLLNEYPEGGGNSVIESMGAGVPVVAVRAGPRHAECIGADLAGDDPAWGGVDSLDDYWRLATRLATDEAARREAGRAQQRRALERLDYPVIARAYERIFRGLMRAGERRS